MRELADLGISYDEALASFEEAIEDAKRQWAAKVLVSYPRREDLEQTAEALLTDLQVDGVEVNSITDSSQETIVKAPPAALATVPHQDSLCVITVGLGEPAQMRDIQGSAFTANHVAKERDIKSWASAPIVIEGVCAGTICALETKRARDWTERDQKLLEKAAEMISEQVEYWAEGQKHLIG